MPLHSLLESEYYLALVEVFTHSFVSLSHVFYRVYCINDRIQLTTTEQWENNITELKQINRTKIKLRQEIHVYVHVC